MQFQLKKPGDSVQDARQAPCLTGVYIIELCWDSEHDLDAFALLGQNVEGRAKVVEEQHVLSCYNVNNLIQHPDNSFSTHCGTITHSGDARAATQEDADETITIRCEHAPSGVNEILIFVAIHQHDDEQQTLNNVKRSQVRVRNDQGEDLVIFRLKDFANNTCIHVASIMLRTDGWECVIIGEGFRGNLNSILTRLAPNGPSNLAASHVLAQPGDLCKKEENSAADLPHVIPITPETLRNRYPSVQEEVLENACGIVRTVNVANITLDDCLTWGKKTQHAHTRIIKRWLNVNKSDVLSDLRQAIDHLQEALANIDMSTLRKVGNRGLVSRLTGASNKARDTALGTFQTKKLEIERIVETAKGKKRAALEIRNRVTCIQHDLLDLENTVHSYVIAGTHIANHLRGAECAASNEQLSDLLETRCEALTRTQAEIMSSSGLSELSVQQILAVVRIADEVILTSVPTWLSNFMALQVVVEQEKPLAPSDIDKVEEDLKKLSRLLQM